MSEAWNDGDTTGRPINFLEDALKITSFGAVSGQDCTAAIDAAFAKNRGFELPIGNYIYNGAGYAGISPWIKGSSQYMCNITLGAGKVLLNNPSVYFSIELSRLTITGGYGAIRHTYTGANSSVQNMLSIFKVTFSGFTGTAISTLSSDMPYWHIEGCRFIAADDDTTIGIYLNGGTDNCTIRDCSFHIVRIGIKTRAGGHMHIDDCDFVRFNSTATNERVDIWYVPGGGYPGEVSYVTDCKFGNEDLLSPDFKILYADEDVASGTDRSNYMPDLVTHSVGFIGLHKMRGNQTMGNSPGSNIAFVHSMTAKVAYCEYSGWWGGTTPPVVLRFAGDLPSPDSFNTNFVGPWGDMNAGTTGAMVIASNDPSVNVIDPGQVMVNDRSLQLPGGTSRCGYKNLVTPSIGAFQIGGTTTRAAIIDSIGGTDAVELTFPTAGQSYFSTLNAPSVGVPIYLEFEAKLGSGTPSPYLEVSLSYSGSPGIIHFTKRITLKSFWMPYRFKIESLRSATATIFLTFKVPTGSANGLQVQVGKHWTYHAYEPQSRRVVGATIDRPSPAIVGPNWEMFDATLGKPIWTNAAANGWVTADGVAAP